MNILNHLDVWMDEAIERSKVVVEAKVSPATITIVDFMHYIVSS